MNKTRITIDNSGIQIPAVLWGEACGRLLLMVHGVQSNKEDEVIALAAQAAIDKGLCALSFDLPEHGERAGASGYPCNPQNGVSDLLAVYRWARNNISREISVFACSLGAYLALLSYPDAVPVQFLFLSPVVSMEHLIEKMMSAAGVTPDRLAAEKVIAQPNGPALDWDYYCYVKAHTVPCVKKTPTAILYGGRDLLCPHGDVACFARDNSAALTVLPYGEHYFHTREQLSALSLWLDEYMRPVNVRPWLDRLTAKDTVSGCRAAEELVRESDERCVCLPHLDDFFALLEHKNSLVRNRALALIAANAKWDASGRIGRSLDSILAHITDEKPITARRCVKALTFIADVRPEHRERIVSALQTADTSKYADSMRPLIERDIREALDKSDVI